MSDNYSGTPQKQSAKGRKSLLIIGIIFLSISVFLAAFVLSFHLIINPAEKRDIQIQSLSEENRQLKTDTQLLQDQLEVVQSELDSYKKKYGGSSATSSNNRSSNSSSSSSNSNSNSSSSNNSSSSSNRTSGSNSSSSSNNGSINMDNN